MEVDGCSGTLAQPLFPDDLWAIIDPLLPAKPPKPKGGRPRVPDRAALTGIIFVLKSGIPWEMLPNREAATRAALLSSRRRSLGHPGQPARSA